MMKTNAGKGRKGAADASAKDDARRRLSADVLRCSKCIDEANERLRRAIAEFSRFEDCFDGQRELQLRCRMVSRAFKAAVGLAEGNKPRLRMIDEDAL